MKALTTNPLEDSHPSCVKIWKQSHWVEDYWFARSIKHTTYSLLIRNYLRTFKSHVRHFKPLDISFNMLLLPYHRYKETLGSFCMQPIDLGLGMNQSKYSL